MNPLALLHLSPGVGEVLLVLFVILILFGADQLPGIARSLGRWLHQVRRAADDFHDQLLDADLSPPANAGQAGKRPETTPGTDASSPGQSAAAEKTSHSASDSGAHDG